MSRVVLDTNVYISALMFGGLPGALLDLAFLRSFTLIVSRTLLDELDEKLRVKFGVSAEDAALLRARLENLAQVVEPEAVLNVVTDDPDDNRVLECAVKGRADVIVSGDRHLLKLGRYRGISIVTVRQFLESAEASLDE
jgi:putative PIN family toxin of toxin-antitoxin system